MPATNPAADVEWVAPMGRSYMHFAPKLKSNSIAL